jgi:hypothetical protein
MMAYLAMNDSRQEKPNTFLENLKLVVDVTWVSWIDQAGQDSPHLAQGSNLLDHELAALASAIFN